MYRLSPFTYLISGMLSTGLANNDIVCSSIEYVKFNPPANRTCLEYMSLYINATGGYLRDESATANCEFCTASKTNTYLTLISSSYSTRWRNFGIMWAYIVFNVFAALGFYWWARVPRKQKVQEEAPVDISRTQTAASKISNKMSRRATNTNEKAA